MAGSRWVERFPKNTKPAYDELLAFMPESVRALFLQFNDALSSAFNVRNNWQRFDKAAGWVYGYCRNYRCELLTVTIGNGCFTALGTEVTDEETLQRALLRAREAYENGYEARYASLVAKKKADQIERTRTRLAREKEELAQLAQGLDPGLLNRFRWAPKVPRRKLVQLYQSDAQGRMDEELLDEVGYTFYTRCKQAREIRAHLEGGRLVCHNCGAVLSPGSYTAAVTCPCGHSYTYREYRRSCNAANMPGGRATPVFLRFEQKWPGCKDAKEKMLLVDWLVHECHVSLMSGEKGRSVCANLVEGTLPQLRETLEALAGP